MWFTVRYLKCHGPPRSRAVQRRRPPIEISRDFPVFPLVQRRRQLRSISGPLTAGTASLGGLRFHRTTRRGERPCCSRSQRYPFVRRRCNGPVPVGVVFSAQVYSLLPFD